MTKGSLLGASVVLGVALGCAPAQAQLFKMPSGQGSWYIGGEGGWTGLNNQSDRGLPASFPGGTTGHVHFDDGFNVGARAGYQWGPWRFEEEYSYHHSSLASLDGVGHSVWRGHRDLHAIMTNVIYDFALGLPVTPHIGVGIGAVDLVDSASFHPAGPSAGPTGRLLDDNDWVFGYQAIAGVEYNLNRSLSLDLDYRYLATTDATLKSAGGGHYKTGYDSHNVVASLIFHFRPPAPPPPPAVTPAVAPAPAPVAMRKVFLVFFNWDKSAVTPEGMQIVQQAAAQWRAGHNVRLEVTGYTDRSGSNGYNQRLSERRASAVAGALEHFGVPHSEMAIMGRGENDTRVPTANGVREPQNRRVEIVFPT